MENQSLFAEKLGITQTTLSKYENGTSQVPDDVKLKISQFGINLHWLVTGKGEMLLHEHAKIPKPITVYNQSEMINNDSFIIPILA